MAEAAKEKKSKKSNAGRKPLWDEMDMPSKLDAITGWALQGSTDEDIFTMLGISKDTFYKWKREYTEFSDALKKGKDISNGELLNSAFRQSMGFVYTEQQAIKVKVDQFEERIELVDVQRFAPPNPTMTIFMMKNRLPDKYKDKHEVDTTIKEISIQLPEELR